MKDQSERKRIHMWRYIRSWSIYAVVVIAVIVVLDIYRTPDGRGLSEATLTTIDGKQIDFSPQTPPTILYFWGNWCIYCRYTSPTIDALHNEGYPVVTIAMQSGSESDVQAYLSEHGWDFPVVNDPDGQISAAFAVVATPTIAIVHNKRISIATSGWTSKYGLKLRLWLASLRG
ncbi:protein disulfide oxidoreductase [Cardiobacteriaceae bacterium TAE3-ERU3]|nr:protein disulfide oxidoreductase [Cardiobacteriaceae bacterium TAE3-ERU3]